MRFARPLLLALVCCCALRPTGPAEAQQLRGGATVEGEVVHLGDLFSGIPDSLAKRPIARAPQPGQRVAFEAQTLASFANAAGLNWQPGSRADRVIVERAGQPVDRGLIQKAVADALRDQLGGTGAVAAAGEHEVGLDSDIGKVIAPVGAPPQVGVEQINYDRASGRFTAMVFSPPGDPAAERVRVNGRVFAIIEVPVLARPVSANEVIRDRDVQIQNMRVTEVTGGVVTDLQRLVGKSARRPLPALKPVRATDLVAPVLVARNSQVTVRVVQGTMTLAMQGRALDEGSEGERVRVLNTRSNKQIEGTVIGAGLVQVGSAAAAAAQPAR